MLRDKEDGGILVDRSAIVSPLPPLKCLSVVSKLVRDKDDGSILVDRSAIV